MAELDECCAELVATKRAALALEQSADARIAELERALHRAHGNLCSVLGVVDRCHDEQAGREVRGAIDMAAHALGQEMRPW